jgi:heat shock protein HslJ
VSESAEGANRLVGTRWLLRTLEGVAIQPDRQVPFLELVDDGGGSTAVFGHSGCNSFRGAYTVDGASLSFGVLAGTRMACPPPETELEARFLRALAAVERYEVRGPWLVLSGPEGEAATLEAGSE